WGRTRMPGPPADRPLPHVQLRISVGCSSWYEHFPLTIDRSVIEWLEKMRRRVLADPAADRGTHLGAVAPVHPAPHTRVAFLGVDVVDAGVGTNRAAIALECQQELIGAEPHRVEPQRGRADRGVSRGIFGVGRR